MKNSNSIQAHPIYSQVSTSDHPADSLHPMQHLSATTAVSADSNDSSGSQHTRKLIYIGIGTTVVIALAGVGILIWYFVFRSSTYFSSQEHEVLGKITLHPETRTGTLFTGPRQDAPSLRMGEGTAAPLTFHSSCSVENKESLIKDARFRYVCLQYSSGSSTNGDYRMLVQNSPNLKNDSKTECYDIQWDFPAKDSLKDCFFSHGTQVYGGGQRRFQTWPSNLQPLVNQQVVHDPFTWQSFTSVVVPYWLFSSGVSIMGNTSQNTIFADLNNTAIKDEGFCIGTDAKNPTTFTASSQTLLYTLCFGDNMTHVHKNSIKKYRGPVVPPLDESIIRKPIWTTLSMATDENGTLNQDAVSALAEVLKSEAFPISRILIDPRWEATPGEDTFDIENFHDPVTLFDSFHAFSITPQLMVHPFLSSLSSTGRNPQSSQFISRDPTGQTLNANWILGEAVQMNFTSNIAIDWKRSRIKALIKEQPLADCRFLGGASGWISSCCDRTLTKYWRDMHSEFSRSAASICGENVQVEMSAGFDGRIIRMADFPVGSASPQEGLKVQLKSLIPAGLTISLVGHPIFIPSMVGGNPYLDDSGRLEIGIKAESRYPTSDRYLRWLAAVLFMPVIEFSILPTFYESEEKVKEYTKKLLAIREKNMEYIVDSAKAAVATGEPLVRPMWWNYPEDRTTWTIDDQFFVGDDLLVAPLVTPGAVTRQVYLPDGKWLNSQGGIEVPGTVDVVAALDEVPYYFRYKG